MKTIDPIARFSDCVDAYARARPDYPDAVASVILRELGLPATVVVADIGSGTGQSSAPFLRVGCTVRGVEPNRPMREASLGALADYAAFSAVDGRAEETTLADASCDLAIAGQAFHWFRHDEFRREVKRILKPDGALALFWNSRDHAASRFMADYNELLLTHCPEYRARWKGDDVGSKHADAMTLTFGHRHWNEATLPHSQRLSRQLLIDRVESDSYAPPPDDPSHGPMIAALDDLFDAHASNGVVTMLYRTRLFYGRPN
jgi:SAM-dependent methyltransferase